MTIPQGEGPYKARQQHHDRLGYRCRSARVAAQSLSLNRARHATEIRRECAEYRNADAVAEMSMKPPVPTVADDIRTAQGNR